MGIFELIGEKHDPAPFGRLDVGPPGRPPDGPRALRAVVALAALGGWVAFLVLSSGSTRGLILGGVLTALYLVASAFLRPAPDYSNLGFMGGLVNHPFRYSDNINRFLLLLRVALAPGRWIVAALLDLASSGRGRSE
jgi:hypothetical protein